MVVDIKLCNYESKKNRYIIAFLTLSLGFSACNKYLDVMPDNRAELNTETKIDKLLVSAYAESSNLSLTEFSSDNVDDYGSSNPNSERLLEEIFRWKDVSETGLDSPKELWESSYKAIGSANLALEAIAELGNPSSLDAQRGEALAARAFNHFVLVNTFAQHYTKGNAATDLGIPYMFKSETTLNPQYTRNTVKEVYDFIVKDLEEALPLIDDASYGSTPKFHMNLAATNALAARVALYMQNWEKALQYADAAIGTNPAPILRNNRGIAANAVSSVTGLAVFYNASSEKANLMLQTSFSNQGLYFGAYYVGSRYSHGALISNTETFLSDAPFGVRSSTGYIPRVYVYGGTNLDKNLVARVSYMFEFTDPVAQIGFRHAVHAPFTTEETMLVRAEALIHLKRFDQAVTDMKRWVDNTLAAPPATFSVASINTWGNRLAYHTPKMPTPKKKFNTEFTVEAGTQENMLHALLFIRRLETMHLGLRWFDVKRYGIEIERRVLTSGGEVGSVETATKLVARDNRQAIQLPQEIISAGLTPNPR